VNVWAFQYLFTVCCCIALVIVVYRRNPREILNRKFCLLCISLGSWAFIQFGLSLSHSLEEAAIWRKFLAIWPLIVVVSLDFALQFTERERIVKSLYYRTAVVIPAIAFAILELTTGLIFGTVTKHYVGWIAGTAVFTPLWTTATIWFVLCLLLMVFLISRYAFTVADRHKRSQARVFFIALLIGVVVTFRDVLVIAFSWHTPLINPTGFAFTVAFIGFAILRFRLFSLTPMTAAESIISTMDDMLLLADRQGKILTANKATRETLGYCEKELIGQHVSTLFATPLVWLNNILSKDELAYQKVTDLEISFVRKNKSTIPVSLSGTGIRGQGNIIQGVILIGRDISARKQFEAEKADIQAKYEQAQKLESIGRLAGGIAHDMNNMLSAIMASALVIREELATNTVANESIDNVLSACYRGRDLTQNLLGFARKGKYVKSDLSINQLVNETVAILRRTISKRIEIKTSLEDNLSAFEGDRGQIGSVLMNVCINAVDSITISGEVSINTSAIWLDENRCLQLGGLEPGNYIQLTVIDNGVGMDEETLKNAFEPFFTTKPIGKGTGLGLSMAYGVVVNHGGAITIDSEVGKGTTVTAYFPSTDRPTPKLVPNDCLEYSDQNHANREQVGRTGILLIDDEPLFRSSAKRLISKLGHEVFVAENGYEALEVYRLNSTRISVVLLDMLMPGMEGKEVFYKLKAINPKVKVVIISGFDKDENVDNLLSHGANGYLQKPFNSQVLSRQLEAVLMSRVEFEIHP
jgi:PAS domain S-box-containing protein